MGKVAQNRFTVWLSRHKILASLLFLLGAFATLVAAMAFLPFKLQKLPESSPATSFEGAMMRLQAIIKAQNAQPELMPVCHTKVMSHGEKVENVIVLFHGLTSCPEQFAQLGERFFGKGYNVIIPLQPHHGEKDRLNPSLPEMSSEELAQFATQYIDIARGLGESVTIAGISGGGTLTTWLAQTRDDIQTAMPISPFLGIRFVPTWLNRPVAKLLDKIPNIWMWWDPIKKEDNPFTDAYQYPRYTTKAIAAYMRLGFIAERAAKVAAPTVKVIVVSNESDLSVNLGVIDQFVCLWRENPGKGDTDIHIQSYRFDSSLKLPHDIITPQRFEGNTTIVYPKIFELLGVE